MTSPARAVQSNTEAIRRVQHLSDAAVLLWPDAPHLAQYYLFRMQQAAEKDNLKIPHRTASKICQACGGLITSKLRLVSSKRRTRRSAQLAARETRSQMNMMLAHMNAPDAAPSTHPRNVLQQHCARCDYKRLYIAFQHAPVAHETPVTQSTAATPPAPVSHVHTQGNTNTGTHTVPAKMSTTSTVPAKMSTTSTVPAKMSTTSTVPAKMSTTSTVPAKMSTTSTVPAKMSTTSTVPAKHTSTAASHTTSTQSKHAKHSMKSQVAKMLHETKNSTNKKKNVQNNLKQFLNSINM